MGCPGTVSHPCPYHSPTSFVIFLDIAYYAHLPESSQGQVPYTTLYFHSTCLRAIYTSL